MMHWKLLQLLFKMQQILWTIRLNNNKNWHAYPDPSYRLDKCSIYSFFFESLDRNDTNHYNYFILLISSFEHFTLLIK
ncbi:Nuclear RNA export factor [Dirofilaria immitis]